MNLRSDGQVEGAPNGGRHAAEGEITRDLDRVQHAIFQYLTELGGLAAQIARHILIAPGKLVRPRLCLASAYASAPSRATEEVVRAATAVELLHVGSLYHDDVIDEADTRRGKSTVNSEWGNVAAVLGGDLLLAGSASIAADLGQYESQVLAATLQALCVGELEETRTLFDRTRSVGEYFLAIQGKTASLFEAACILGAYEASEVSVETFALFGRLLGLAFQIIDDVLDFGAVVSTGKAVGADWRAGVYTLPVILTAGELEQNRDLFATSDIAEVRQALDRAGGIARSLWYAEQFVTAAVGCIDGSVAPGGLLSLAASVTAPVIGCATHTTPSDQLLFHAVSEEMRSQRGVIPILDRGAGLLRDPLPAG